MKVCSGWSFCCLSFVAHMNMHLNNPRSTPHSIPPQQEVDDLACKQPPPKDLQERQMQALKQGAEFLFRSHQLVSGFDAATKQSYAAFAAVLRSVQDGAYVPAGQRGTVAAAAEVVGDRVTGGESAVAAVQAS